MAQEKNEKSGAEKNAKIMEVEIDGEVFEFHITRADWATFQKELRRLSDGAATRNLLVATVKSMPPKELADRCNEDWTLANLLMEPIGEKLGASRVAHIKK